MEIDDKDQIQNNVKYGRKDKKIKRRFTVPKGTDNAGKHIIEHRSKHSAKDDDDVFIRKPNDIGSRIHQLQKRHGKQDAESG